MKKIPKRYLDYVNSTIAMLQAFKKGKPVQRKGKYTTGGRWVTFDLGKFIDSKPLMYRPKP